MIALAMDKSQLRTMINIARVLDSLDALREIDQEVHTLAEASPMLFQDTLKYLNQYAAPEITTEAEIRKVVHSWLSAYATMYGPEDISDLGVDTQH